REHLPVLCEGAFDLEKRRSGARGQHELGGLVIDDSGARARVQNLAAQLAAVEILAAAAADAQRPRGRGRAADRLGELMDGFLQERAVIYDAVVVVIPARGWNAAKAR